MYVLNRFGRHFSLFILQAILLCIIINRYLYNVYEISHLQHYFGRLRFRFILFELSVLTYRLSKY